ncbi:MAG: HesB/IscA family protein [Planctomycetota bacterium]
MIQITDSAKREIKRLISQAASEPLSSGVASQSTGAATATVEALRLYVQGGGCAGMSYGIEVVHDIRKEDKVFDCDGAKVVVDPKSYLFLKGVVMDFKESLMGRGFVFQNPNATGSCGCGTSFSM